MSSSVTTFVGLTAFFFASRARRAASATDCAGESWDCANAATGRTGNDKRSATKRRDEVLRSMTFTSAILGWVKPQDTPKGSKGQSVLRRLPPSAQSSLCKIGLAARAPNQEI